MNHPIMYPMKCPKCRGRLATMEVYGTTYHRCMDEDCRTYFDSEFYSIDDITEYKNKIRRRALKKLLNITEVDEDQE